MRVYPQRSLGIGLDMRNECTCGHCRLAHVKRESNTARVYKMQLPPIKTKKAQKGQPRKTATQKLVSGYQTVPKKKTLKKPVQKSVVRSKPEYDAWYFSDADLHTIAHSNMNNYLSRFQPDLQEVATQTSLPRSPKPATKASSKDQAVQIALSDKEAKNSFNKRHKDRGDSPTRRPVALSALMNYRQDSGDFNLKPPPENLNFNGNSRKIPERKSNLEPDVGEIISMPLKPQYDTVSDSDHLRKSHWTDVRFKPRYTTDLDDFMKSPFPTKILHSRSKNRIQELLDSEKYRLPRDDVNLEKPSHRQKHDKKTKPHKIENHGKITRKLLETSLKREKEARKFLKMENDGLKNCISKAEQKVRDMRSSLAELSHTIRTYKTKSGLPYVKKVEKLEKLVDELIREFRSSSKAKTANEPNSPKPQGGQPNDVHANCVVIATESPPKDEHEKAKEPKNDTKDVFELDLPGFEDEHFRNIDWSNVSSISSGIVSRVTVSSTTTSLTALKQELGKFFEEMKEDTEKLIEEAQLHHEALLSYSDSTSSIPSYGSMSTINSQIG